MSKNTKPDYTPGVQAGTYETPDARDVEQEVKSLNSLQAYGDKQPSLTEDE